ncbi:hypothetical protein [Thalassovita sp.]|uniref:hypothetical protein n=1 Tax=Thalassovita sp. TaxID=1979401 RepID=UPI0029DE5333|nr:hypothetical protein [Thalassovita sp.]
MKSGVARRHVTRQLRLAYLAPDVLRRLIKKREVPAVPIREMTDIAALPFGQQEAEVFGVRKLRKRWLSR